MISIEPATAEVIAQFITTPGIDYLANSGTTFMAVHDGVPIAVAGVMILWPGVGEGWACLSDEVKRFPVFLHKSVVQALRMIHERHNLHRIQCIVDPVYMTHIRWAERLGFEFEGLMKQYTSDKTTMLRMAITYG